ncbi:hypothetical protein GCM10009555_032650 [Acrocarpospora macrocephala]|uniref:Uncharacterized protein n=2 Tax=Acrocarpospora macrocephala TaxID=150177 RepID=A0A5M3WC72_9ACTN|nr:hypothetical protein Amac_000410 [Acrocarpospora macrocephala]
MSRLLYDGSPAERDPKDVTPMARFRWNRTSLEAGDTAGALPAENAPASPDHPTSDHDPVPPDVMRDRLAALYALVMTDDSLDDPDQDPEDWEITIPGKLPDPATGEDTRRPSNWP